MSTFMYLQHHIFSLLITPTQKKNQLRMDFFSELGSFVKKSISLVNSLICILNCIIRLLIYNKKKNYALLSNLCNKIVGKTLK